MQYCCDFGLAFIFLLLSIHCFRRESFGCPLQEKKEQDAHCLLDLLDSETSDELGKGHTVLHWELDWGS